MIWLRAPKWFCARVVAVAPTSPLPVRAVLRLRPLHENSAADAELNEQAPHRLIRKFDACISGLSRLLLPPLAYYAVRSMFGFCSPLLHLGSPRWRLSALMKKCVCVCVCVHRYLYTRCVSSCCVSLRPHFLGHAGNFAEIMKTVVELGTALLNMEDLTPAFQVDRPFFGAP